MKKVHLASLIVLVSGFLWSGLPCFLPMGMPSLSEASEVASEGNPGSPKSHVIKDLPCFKCHIYDRFIQEPSTGVFSHALHIQFDYHCNQCHSFRGHRQMVINTNVCTFCHESVPELKKS